MGFAGLLPLLPQAWAYISAFVDLPIANRATYNVATSNQLISCTITSPLNITTKGSKNPQTGNVFRCVNNYNNPVTLKWAIVDDASTGLTIDGTTSAVLNPIDSGATLCRSAKFNASNISSPDVPIVFKGSTDPALNPDFYAEVQFSGTVHFNTANGPSGGCP